MTAQRLIFSVVESSFFMPSILDGFYSLSKNINKTKLDPPDTTEGVVSGLLPELTLEMDDSQLVALKNDWEKQWTEYSEKIKRRQDENEKYWLGKHYPGIEYKDNERPIADNLMFEALETFLPIATRQSPEPVVFSNDTPEGKQLADDVRKMLLYLKDILQFKLKLKKATRFWSLYLLGVAKVGWNEITNEIDCRVIRPQKLILDKDATITEDGEYTGEFIGEYREDLASNLVLRFPEKEAFIKGKVEDKMGTKLGYIEWWTNEYLFWSLDNVILNKTKNPHWNYPQVEMMTDENGQQFEQEVPPYNHFSSKQKPYVFLSVFNLGIHPHDDVSIMEQNLSLQDLTNKRLRQIDKNADAANGGLIVSGANSGLSIDQASNLTEALRRGGTVYIPSGDVNNAVKRETGTPIPGFVYESLKDYRQELRNIFGISASSAEGIKSTETVRGKIMAKSQDESRIALVAEHIEQFSDKIYNWFVQLMCVYYDEPHAASIIGDEHAREYIQLRKQDFSTKLVVSVQEGSLIPKDPLTQRNEAMDLWSAGAIDPVTLFERLDFPNPREAAKKLFMWQSNPGSFFPEQVQQVVPPPPEPGAVPTGAGQINPEIPPDLAVPQAQSDLSQVPLNPISPNP